jgi:APA family basic amino acid/polyamine antiporter
VVPALYVVGAATILVVLFVYRWATTGPGLVIVLLGLPMYLVLKRNQRSNDSNARASGAT